MIHGGAAGVERILVVRADRLGDVILSLPVMMELRERRPRAHLGLLTSAAVAPVLVGHPCIDTLLVDEVGGRHAGLTGFWRLVRTLRAGAFDLAIVLRPTPRHAAVVWAAGIRERVGTAFRAYSCFFNKRVRLHRRRSGRHELELNLELLAAVTGSAVARKPWIPLGDGERDAARVLLPPRGRGGRVILHPGSGGSAREWPLAHYAELAGRLLERGVEVIVTGSAAEVPLADAIVRTAPGAQSVAGRTSLPVLAAVLAEADAIVAGSTGPVHLAGAVGTPAVAIYPPIEDAAPWRWGPRDERSRVLRADAPPCDACIGERCAYWDCMETVRVAQVLTSLAELGTLDG